MLSFLIIILLPTCLSCPAVAGVTKQIDRFSYLLLSWCVWLMSVAVGNVTWLDTLMPSFLSLVLYSLCHIFLTQKLNKDTLVCLVSLLWLVKLKSMWIACFFFLHHPPGCGRKGDPYFFNCFTSLVFLIQLNLSRSAPLLSNITYR